MLVLSLFPGIGLLDRAFEEAGFCVVRGPDLIWGGDVHRFHPPAGRFDGVIGGPPCQQFSPLVHMLRAIGREPQHPNEIPAFERCVGEAGPAWFLMENVRAAPLPVIAGYAVSSFLLCPTWIPDTDGLGHEQSRRRRFSFGVRGPAAPDLRRWIDYAALELPETASAVTSGPEVDNGPGGRVKATTVMAGHGPVPTGRAKEPTVTGHGPSPAGHGNRLASRHRRSLEECCRLQGLPENFLSEAPFTSGGKRAAVGNGVPLPMGRAIARAVKRALRDGVS